jgi:nicotinamide-nucleotide amidase
VSEYTDLAELAASVIGECRQRHLRIATAESCTGGLVVAALTEVAGASEVVDRAFIAYSNAAKSDMLGVARGLIERDGAVSQSVARAMAEGALVHSAADLAAAITGIAGPGGGSAEKPIGLVHFAVVRRGGPTRHIVRRFPDNGRAGIRLAAAGETLRLLQALAQASQTATP